MPDNHSRHSFSFAGTLNGKMLNGLTSSTSLLLLGLVGLSTVMHRVDPPGRVHLPDTT